MGRLNAYMLVTVRLSKWPSSLPIPLPLFVVDHIIEFITLLLRFGGKIVIKHGGRYAARVIDFGMAVDEVWWDFRHSGSYTLLELNHEGANISVRLI